jgi:hypothetical protein
MEGAIPKESTSHRTKSQFPRVKWPKIRPASAAKDSKGGVVWCFMQKEFGWGFVINHFTRKKINQVNCCKKGFIPEL